MEVYKSTKKTISYHNAVSKNTESSYDFRIIGLNYRDRDKLYDKINIRVDEMIKNGLIEEIERLDLNKLSSTAKQAIGYKQFIEFYKNEDPAKSIEQVIEKIKQESRHYAKRQLTWFRKDERINWINVDENNFDEILQKSKKVIEKP
jgi:tRNA dimethylallyltransferase